MDPKDLPLRTRAREKLNMRSKCIEEIWQLNLRPGYKISVQLRGHNFPLFFQVSRSLIPYNKYCATPQKLRFKLTFSNRFI